VRVSRWKPVCPDCGYPVRGLTASRCPECGVDFPTDQKTFRRWAVRRVAWDRVKRGGVLASYLRTFFAILFAPWRAGRGLVVPDHWSRCVRWAVVHLTLAIVVCALSASELRMVRWLGVPVHSSTGYPLDWTNPLTAPTSRMLTWFGQSLVAWAIVILLTVGLGVVLSVGIPGRRRAAKLGGVKWSLYLSAVVLVTLAVWFGYCEFLVPWVAELRRNLLSSYIARVPGVSSPPAVLISGVYGLWWAAGMAANPYNHVRGLRAFFGFALLYAGVWAIIVRLLFPVGPLDVVL
jgi:hypothetical protein